MKSFFLFLFAFSFAISSSAQIEKSVENVLLKKDFVKFQEYSDSISRPNEAHGYWEYKRELIKGYWEGVFCFEKRSAGFRVNILATDSTIIFFDLSEQKSQNREEGPAVYYETLSTSRNDSLFDGLKISFKNTFRTELNFSELFNVSVVFSDGGCGYSGIPPKGKVKTDELVKNKDHIGLQEMLGSANTEMQVYAVSGFYELKKKGETLTPVEKEMINAVLQKKGTIRVCSGCTYGIQEISEATGFFRF